MAGNIKKQNNAKVVLCIDDQPAGYIPGRSPREQLNAVLRSCYADSGYELRFASSWNEVVTSVDQHKKQKDIGLILLDYRLDFPSQEGSGYWQGPDVADWLYEVCPDLKFIGLTTRTDRGTKIEFGHRENKADFIVKKDLQRDYLLNVTNSIVTDYRNQEWKVFWEPSRSYLTMRKGDFEFSTAIPDRNVERWRSSNVLTNALRKPLEWAGPFPGRIANLTVNDVNKCVREKSGGRIWGLLTTERAPAKCIKALVNSRPGGVEISYPPPPANSQNNAAGAGWNQHVEERLKELEKAVAELQKRCPGKAGKSGGTAAAPKAEADAMATMSEDAADERNEKLARRSQK